MSVLGYRDYRPKLHYTPPKGWINDPNGLVFDGKEYHLFAQHYPDATHPGPMHWLHAVSADLIRWRQLGIALAPDELGFIFSGSAIVDTNNTSGLGLGGDPMTDSQNPSLLIAMFTYHGETEQQSIAYSNDGVNFIKYSRNPVIKNPPYENTSKNSLGGSQSNMFDNYEGFYGKVEDSTAFLQILI